MIRPITFGVVKKLIQSVSVFMATLILLQSAFCWLVVFIVWNQHIHYQKEQIEKSIPIEKLTAISFTKNKNAVRINNKEVEMNGEWFDIVFKTGEGENELYYCISDKRESEIMLSIEKENNKSEQQGLVSFLKSQNKDFPPALFSFSISAINSDDLFNSESEKKILSGYKTILYSPPDFKG